MIDPEGPRLRGDSRSLADRYLHVDPRPGAAVYDSPGWETRVMVAGVGYLTSEGWTTKEIADAILLRPTVVASIREIARDCGYVWARHYRRPPPRQGIITSRVDRIRDIARLHAAWRLDQLACYIPFLPRHPHPVPNSVAWVYGANAVWRLCEQGWLPAELAQDFDVPFEEIERMADIVGKNLDPIPKRRYDE